MKKVLLLFMMTAVTLSGAKADGDYFDQNGAYYGPTLPATEAEQHYTGAYYTGNYESPFKTYLGKTDEEIQAKLDQLWNHYFKGNINQKIYYDVGDEAYIRDINNNDVRSEGLAWGMMIAVQTNHKEEFDKIWKWAKNHHWHKSGEWDGYFAWQRRTDGSAIDNNPLPDGEMYFMMSLLFAANRWNDSSYMADAQYILKKMWSNSNHVLFNQQSYVISFQPTVDWKHFGVPAFDLPAFVDLFARWTETRSHKDYWKKSAIATREHLYKSSHPKTGLFADYSNFDGTPYRATFNKSSDRYMYEAERAAMNFGMDYYLFGADKDSQTDMAKRLLDFFESDGYQHARFDWDGGNPQESYTAGQKGCNAVACYALIGEDGYDDVIKKNLQMAWDAIPLTGQYRYYEGIVHYLSMLHLCGAFKIWKPRLVLDETDGVTPLNKEPWNSTVDIPTNFTRTFTKDVASTICLPFAVDASQAAAAGKFYAFVGVDKSGEDWEVIMQETDPSNLVSGGLTANTPYLFIPAATGAVTFCGIIPTTGSASAASVSAEGWTFTGTYDTKQWDDAHNTAEIGSIYGFAAEDGTSTDGSKTIEAGKFFQVAGGANSYIVPFRAYLKYNGGSARKQAAAVDLPQQMTVRLVGADGTVTRIGSATLNDKNDNVVYDLSGRRVQKPTKGLYIMNGKKVLVK